jgi:hypothetical protein
MAGMLRGLRARQSRQTFIPVESSPPSAQIRPPLGEPSRPRSGHASFNVQNRPTGFSRAHFSTACHPATIRQQSRRRDRNHNSGSNPERAIAGLDAGRFCSALRITPPGPFRGNGHLTCLQLRESLSSQCPDSVVLRTKADRASEVGGCRFAAWPIPSSKELQSVTCASSASPCPSPSRFEIGMPKLLHGRVGRRAVDRR